MPLTLEIVEGPGAGTQVQLAGPVVVGRDPSADIVLDDTQASRQHARISPSAEGAVVEDLGSTNGTFVNGNEVQGRAFAGAGDEVIVGVTLFELRSAAQVAHQPSGVRAVPPALAAAERRPTYVDPVADATGGGAAGSSGIPELERLRDSRVKAKAKFAPLSLFVLAVLVVVIYLGATST
jgi:hypothetical protein